MKDLVNKIGRKKFISIGLACIGVLVAIVVAAIIYNKFFYKKSFQEIESIMRTSAMEYYEKHPKQLPQNIGENKTISINTLVKKGYMDPIADLRKDKNLKCKGEVNITNVNGEYRYKSLLDCNTAYSYQTLSDHIKENEPIVTSNKGLYNINNELVYRGEVTNNNVEFAEKKWQIVKITEDNKIELILNEKYDKSAWDDRYNVDINNFNGINNYTTSRIKEYTDQLYTQTTLFNKQNKLLLSIFNLEVGKVSQSDTDKSGNLEKSSIIENQYIGLLPIYEYLTASLDTNCTTSLSKSCQNYNYLSKYPYQWWTMTGDKDKSYYAYKISEQTIELSRTNSKGYIRPIIRIVSDAIYESGDGTESNPYKFS